MLRLFEGKTVAENYVAHRPVYPKRLTELIVRHARESAGSSSQPPELLIDVGCGSGQASKWFQPYMKKVVGVDPSESQIEQARMHTEADNISFIVSNAENLPFEDHTADVICCGMSVHWFDMKKFFQECHRVLKPTGVLALYGNSRPPRISRTFGQIDKCADDLLQELNDACVWHERNSHILDKYQRIFEALPSHQKSRDDTIKMEKEFDLDGFKNYFSTFSGYRRYVEKKKPGENDILEEFSEKLKKLWKVEKGPDAEIKLHATWDIFLLLSSPPIPS